MDFEKEYIPDEQEDFDTDFDTKEITPIKSLRSDPPPQYFTNIDGKYCKDVAGREELDELKALVDDVPWQPLEDGYSNFWFELTNDTLSPWLNFSAKTENAVIDWGDGSGEVALDTLTPTHTYAKAGKYVVKVKGVTGIGRQNIAPFSNDDIYILKAVELNSDITTISGNAFFDCVGIENIKLSSTITTIGVSAFRMLANLSEINISDLSNLTEISANAFDTDLRLDNIVFPQNLTTLGSGVFSNCKCLHKITIPTNVSSIGGTCFYNCSSLAEVHCQATTPPTLGNNVFLGLPSNYIIYVPVGTAETYKSASGWSTYADHILEEGQQPNRAMLAKFNSAKTEEVKDDELYQDENR